jgi:hypothetical protein
MKMQTSDLHVIAVIFNPIRWNSRVALYKKFEQHMLDSGVSLTLVECALGNRPFELSERPHINHVPVRANTLAWNKESLINIGIHRLPESAQRIAWIDADIEFRAGHWVMDTLHALEQYPVIQPWSEALDLGPDGSPMFTKGSHVQKSFCKIWQTKGKTVSLPYSYGHPGYAWAARRSTIDSLGGLLDISALGAADHQMAMAMAGDVGKATPVKTTENYREHIRAWAQRADIHVAGKIGYCHGVIEHSFHGEKRKRQYQNRWQILIDHGFSPLHDLQRNSYGVIEFTGNKPGLEIAVDRYYRQRDEDQNVLFETAG